MRTFLVDRTGDGSDAAPFSPDVPEGTYWWGYTTGTKFLIATESDLSALPTAMELTSATAVSMATLLYGITPDHLSYEAGDPVSFLNACQECMAIASHSIGVLVNKLLG